MGDTLPFPFLAWELTDKLPEAIPITDIGEGLLRHGAAALFASPGSKPIHRYVLNKI